MVKLHKLETCNSFLQAVLYLLYFTRTYISYLVGGRAVSTFRSLYSESADESQLIAREGSDLEGESMAVSVPKSYCSLE